MTTIAWKKCSLRQLAYLWAVHTLLGLSPKAKKEEDGHQNVGHVATYSTRPFTALVSAMVPFRVFGATIMPTY